jgi:DNA-binding NarL/FixJ family response regulator
MQELAKLSPREKEILSLFARGGSAKAIAFALGLSHRTVEAHSARIVAKLAAANRMHAVAMAVGAGVVSL